MTVIGIAIDILTLLVDNNPIMKITFSIKAKRNISLVIMLLISAVYCGSIDLSYDTFGLGGIIKGSDSTAFSRSLITSTPVGLRENAGRGNGNGQNFEKSGTSSDILSILSRKLLQLFDGTRIPLFVIRLRSYFTTICITGFAYLFLLTHICFIHLKDGSK